MSWWVRDYYCVNGFQKINTVSIFLPIFLFYFKITFLDVYVCIALHGYQDIDCSVYLTLLYLPRVNSDPGG
jgi:hypothetical protein